MRLQKTENRVFVPEVRLSIAGGANGFSVGFTIFRTLQRRTAPARSMTNRRRWKPFPSSRNNGHAGHEASGGTDGAAGRSQQTHRH